MRSPLLSFKTMDAKKVCWLPELSDSVVSSMVEGAEGPVVASIDLSIEPAGFPVTLFAVFVAMLWRAGRKCLDIVPRGPQNLVQQIRWRLCQTRAALCRFSQRGAGQEHTFGSSTVS